MSVTYKLNPHSIATLSAYRFWLSMHHNNQYNINVVFSVAAPTLWNRQILEMCRLFKISSKNKPIPGHFHR
jgi:hypothetical protein